MESSNACLWVLSGAFCQSLRNLEFEFSPISSCKSILRTNALFRPNQSWDPVFQVWLFKVSFSFLSYNHENKSCSFPEAEGKQLNINVKGNLGPQWHLAGFLLLTVWAAQKVHLLPDAIKRHSKCKPGTFFRWPLPSPLHIWRCVTLVYKSHWLPCGLRNSVSVHLLWS